MRFCKIFDTFVSSQFSNVSSKSAKSLFSELFAFAPKIKQKRHENEQKICRTVCKQLVVKATLKEIDNN